MPGLIPTWAIYSAVASHRLVERLWQRFPWLTEYFRWEGQHVVSTFSSLRPARSIGEQRAQFSSRLPGHILVVQMGGWHELWGIEHSLPAVGERVHRRRLPQISAMLWEKSAPVAWVEETGRRERGSTNGRWCDVGWAWMRFRATK